MLQYARRKLAKARGMQSYLEKHSVLHNQARFYRLRVMPDLFGTWTLYREWGRIGQGGKIRLDWFDTQSAAATALLNLEASKRKRGYWVQPQQLALL